MAPTGVPADRLAANRQALRAADVRIDRESVTVCDRPRPTISQLLPERMLDKAEGKPRQSKVESEILWRWAMRTGRVAGSGCGH